MDTPTTPFSRSEPPAPTLTRRVRFRARHRYEKPQWDDARNQEVFGAQRRSHEHEWVLEVTVLGPLDPETGWSVDLAELESELFALRDRLEGGDLGDAIPDFAPGLRMPSTEELARWFWTLLSGRFGGRTDLVAVRVAESEELWSECRRPPTR